MKEAALVVVNESPELTISGKLLTRTALAPFGCQKYVIKIGECGDRSADELFRPKLPVETMNDGQGLSGSGNNKEQDEE